MRDAVIQTLMIPVHVYLKVQATNRGGAWGVEGPPGAWIIWCFKLGCSLAAAGSRDFKFCLR